MYLSAWGQVSVGTAVPVRQHRCRWGLVSVGAYVGGHNGSALPHSLDLPVGSILQPRPALQPGVVDRVRSTVGAYRAGRHKGSAPLYGSGGLALQPGVADRGWSTVFGYIGVRYAGGPIPAFFETCGYYSRAHRMIGCSRPGSGHHRDTAFQHAMFPSQ